MKLKRIEPGQIVPFGLSRSGKSGYNLRVPLMVWVRRGYSIEWDRFARGWWRFELGVRIKHQEISIRWWWNLLKESNEQPS